MDNLCHTLVGLAMGEAGLKNKTRYGNAALVIAANVPDIDVLVFLTNTPSVEFRRGWTHGIVAQLLLPVLTTAVIVARSRTFSPLLPVPATHAQPLVQMCRRRRHHADRLLVLRDRDHDLAGMQMQDRFAESGPVAVDVVADDRPAHR